MNDLNPRKTVDGSLPEQGPSVDFRADPDVSIHLDRDEFVQQEGQSAEVKSPAGLEAVLQAFDISGSNEFMRNLRQHVLEAEDQKRQHHAQTLLAGEIFEKVEVVLRSVDVDLAGTPETSILQHLRGAIGEVLQGVAPVLKSGREISPAEAERIIQSAGLLRKLLNQALSQLCISQQLTTPQRDLFSSLEAWLREIGEPEAYIRRKKRPRRKGKKIEKEPLILRLLKGVVTVLKVLVTGSDSAPEKSRERISPATKPEPEAADRLERVPSAERREQIPEDSSAMFVHVLRGRVYSRKDRSGIEGVHIAGGALGDQITDRAGEFFFTDVAHGFSFVIGPHRDGMTFSPPVVSGIALDSMEIEFEAID